MAETVRPLPRLPEPDTQTFWQATREHRLVYQRCAACGAVVFYPRQHCTRCGGDRLQWQAAAGEGTIYTFTLIRQNGHPFFKERLPYVLALVDLDEGFRLMTHVVGVDDPDRDVHVGQRVRLDWEDQGELALPVFRPA
jgi:uncharacterized OB-fold protein